MEVMREYQVVSAVVDRKGNEDLYNVQNANVHEDRKFKQAYVIQKYSSLT